MPKGDKTIRCSFCGKTQEEVERIIAGPGVYICDECIKVCTNIIENDLYEDSEITYEKETPTNLPKPEEIKKILDEYGKCQLSPLDRETLRHHRLCRQTHPRPRRVPLLRQ